MHLYINFENKNLSVAFQMNQSEQDFWSHCRVVAVDKVEKAGKGNLRSNTIL